MSWTQTFHKSRFDNLDMVRGLAAFLVALCHFADFGGYKMPVALGGLCVGYFFILSAFVLCHAYQDQIGVKSFTFRDFIVARFARIYPLHILTFVVVLVFWWGVDVAQKYGLHFNTAPERSWLEIFENLSMTHLIFSGKVAYNTPSWSIGVEFWCGIYIFLLCFPVCKIYKYLSLGVFALAYLAVLHIGGFLNAKEQYAFGYLEKNYVTGMFLFATGWVLYQFYLIAPIGIKNINPVLAWSAVAFLVVMIWWPPFPIEIFNYMELPYFLLIALTVYLLAFPEPKNPRLAGLMQEVGNMSFGIYLWHVPIMLLLTTFSRNLSPEHQITKPVLTLMYCAMVIAVSWLSYRIYELPSKKFLRRRLSRV